MRTAGIRELRAEVLGGAEPVVVTKYGQVSGVFLPLEDPRRIPTDLRKELAGVLGRHLAQRIRARGITGARVAEDFGAYRRRRR